MLIVADEQLDNAHTLEELNAILEERQKELEFIAESMRIVEEVQDIEMPNYDDTRYSEEDYIRLEEKQREALLKIGHTEESIANLANRCISCYKTPVLNYAGRVAAVKVKIAKLKNIDVASYIKDDIESIRVIEENYSRKLVHFFGYAEDRDEDEENEISREIRMIKYDMYKNGF